jgi:iron(III) transport system ATP-binding protein
LEIYILALLYIKLGCYIITENDLIIHDLNKKYGNVIALKDINIEVERGSIAGILGPTGSGKTTLLKCIAGIEIPDSGEIYIGGNLVTSVKEGIYVRPEKRAIGMVFQSYALWPHMSVYENVAFPLKVRGLARSEIDRRVKEILSIVGLKGFERRYPHQLSGGQQQRVALARALVYEPKLLLLDEPLSNIDAKLRLELRSWIRGLVKRLGITTLYVTHDQAEALSMADKIIILNKGTIVQQGRPEELYRRPVNPFVADFLGTANILEGVLIDITDYTLRVKINDKILFEIKRNGKIDPLLKNKRIYLTFKGEDIEITGSRANEKEPWYEKYNVFKGVVREALFEGPFIRVIIDLEETGLEIKAIVPREKSRHIYIGSSITVKIDPENIHIMPVAP